MCVFGKQSSCLSENIKVKEVGGLSTNLSFWFTTISWYISQKLRVHLVVAALPGKFDVYVYVVVDVIVDVNVADIFVVNVIGVDVIVIDVVAVDVVVVYVVDVIVIDVIVVIVIVVVSISSQPSRCCCCSRTQSSSR